MTKNTEPDDDNTRTHVVLTKGTMVSHYRIIEKIGAGGMGEVYLAEDTKLGRQVALKFLPAQVAADEESRSRFTREARAAAMLNHPNIVTIFEVGEFSGRPFFAMEHVEGQTLHHSSHGEPLSINKVIDLAIQLCEGLGKAHQMGIVHRDIKTTNIIVDDDGRPKILDFGLAAVKGSEHLTKAGSTLGTVAYMSPEQAQGDGVDQRSDLFSFGVVLYELIAGRIPFKRDSDAATLKAIINDTAEPLARFRSNVPDELQRIVTKLLQRDPSLRYQTAEGVVSDLRPFAISGSSISVVPDKRKSKAWLAASVVAVVVAAASIFFWLRSHEEAVKSDRPVLVVLPFENLGLPDDEYFADGMTDEITSRLAGVKGLGVISRTSAMQYKKSGKTLKEIGSELGADYVLEGTVRWSKTGESQRVRITPQLIRVSDDQHVWADNIERSLTEVFEVQTSIAEDIVEALGITLLEPERVILSPVMTNDIEAYDYYLRGNHLIRRSQTGDDLRVATEMFKKAIALDPGFAAAYASLSTAYSFLYFFYFDVEAADSAKAAVDLALALSPQLPDAHLTLGLYYSAYKLEHEQALKELALAEKGKANQVNLHMTYQFVLRRLGRWDEALYHAREVVRLSPREIFALENLAGIYAFQDNYDEADRLYDQALKLEPDDQWSRAQKIILSICREGTLDSARSIIEQAPGHLHPVDFMWDGGGAAREILGMWRFGLIEDTSVDLVSEFKKRYDGYRPHVYWTSLAEIYKYMGMSDSAHIYYDSSRIYLEPNVKKYPNEYHFHTELGLIYSCLGLHKQAIEYGKKAKEILPISSCHW